MNLTLSYLRIFARDWDRLTDFYEKVLGLEARFRNAQLGWAEFDTGEASLAVERVQTDDPEAEALAGRFLGVSLAVDDIHSAYASLTARNVKFLSQPSRQPWGGWLAHFEDPEGNVLTLLGSDLPAESRRADADG